MTKNIEKTQEINRNDYDKKRKECWTLQYWRLYYDKNIDNIVGVNKKLIPEFIGPYVKKNSR